MHCRTSHYWVSRKRRGLEHIKCCPAALTYSRQRVKNKDRNMSCWGKEETWHIETETVCILCFWLTRLFDQHIKLEFLKKIHLQQLQKCWNNAWRFHSQFKFGSLQHNYCLFSVKYCSSYGLNISVCFWGILFIYLFIFNMSIEGKRVESFLW